MLQWSDLFRQKYTSMKPSRYIFPILGTNGNTLAIINCITGINPEKVWNKYDWAYNYTVDNDSGF